MLRDLTKANLIISDERVPFLTENNFQILSLPSPLFICLPRLLVFRLSVGPLVLLRPPYYLELESALLDKYRYPMLRYTIIV